MGLVKIILLKYLKRIIKLLEIFEYYNISQDKILKILDNMIYYFSYKLYKKK
jgi:hypothetical protein